ncbi:MAG TPA: hypothetical protein VES20_00950, partial [Bryobacteraceae bacterium]|nr:hypothetical protein [Bryobacteraceae bacterium]
VKTDALDHYDDHFFPGRQDIAWDVAGAAVEFGFDPELLLSRMETADSALSNRVPFYTKAYLAYRIGYCSMAGPQFDDIKLRYAAALAAQPAD